jgi:D-3-phosphoglycerate dehydrogenase
MFLIIGALRNFNTGMMALRQGKWRGQPPPSLGHDPEGKVLGILGMGGIGRNLKKKADAFGMKTIYHNRRRLAGDLEGCADYVSFDELLAQSDVISLNLPLNVRLCNRELCQSGPADLPCVQKHTHHIISHNEFAKMKDGVVIVNTARGAVIDEEALVQALDSGKVCSAGLDVFEDEPNVHPGLVRNPNVMLVPHMGTWTVEVRDSFLCVCSQVSNKLCQNCRHRQPWRSGRLIIFATRSKLESSSLPFPSKPIYHYRDDRHYPCSALCTCFAVISCSYTLEFMPNR